MREPEFEGIEPHASRLKEPAFSSLLANVWAAKVSPELPLSCHPSVCDGFCRNEGHRNLDSRVP